MEKLNSKPVKLAKTRKSNDSHGFGTHTLTHSIRTQTAHTKSLVSYIRFEWMRSALKLQPLAILFYIMGQGLLAN